MKKTETEIHDTPFLENRGKHKKIMKRLLKYDAFDKETFTVISTLHDDRYQLDLERLLKKRNFAEYGSTKFLLLLLRQGQDEEKQNNINVPDGFKTIVIIVDGRFDFHPKGKEKNKNALKLFFEETGKEELVKKIPSILGNRRTKTEKIIILLALVAFFGISIWTIYMLLKYLHVL